MSEAVIASKSSHGAGNATEDRPKAARWTPRSTFPEEARLPIRNQSDIAAVEAVPLSERALPESSYAALVEASKRSPDARALSFFLSADRLDEAHVWTYAELVADVTRAANVFAALGVAADRPVAYVLPNLPETHFAIWGGEAAGAALAVNPMLEPKQVADILRFARASILVTLAPALNPKAWSGLADELASLPDLQRDRLRRHGRLPRRREARGRARLDR